MAATHSAIVRSGVLSPSERERAKARGAVLALTKDEFLARVRDHDPEMLDILSREIDPQVLLGEVLKRDP